MQGGERRGGEGSERGAHGSRRGEAALEARGAAPMVGAAPAEEGGGWRGPLVESGRDHMYPRPFIFFMLSASPELAMSCLRASTSSSIVLSSAQRFLPASITSMACM